MKSKSTKKVTNKEDIITETVMPDGVDSKTINRLSRRELIIAILGFVFGVVIILLGIILLLNIDRGEIELLVKIIGLHIEVTSAPPGIVISLIGLIVIYITRYRIL